MFTTPKEKQATHGVGSLAGLRLTFGYGAGGKVDSLSLPLEPAVAPIVFRRKEELKR